MIRPLARTLALLGLGLLYAAPAEAAPTMTVVFSKQPIKSPKPEGAGGTTTFEAGDPIYARIYTTSGQSILSHQNIKGNPVGFSLSVDGNRINYYALELTKEELGRPFADLHLFPKAGTPPQMVQTQTKKRAVLAEVLTSQLSEGTHEVAVDMGNWGKSTFKITLGADGKDKLEKLAKAAEASTMGTETLPKPAMRNKALEGKMLGLAKKSSHLSKDKILSVVITDGWTVEHHKVTGKPIEKNIFAAVAQQESADKCYYQTIRFTQPHLGGGRYGALAVGGVGLGTKKYLACKNARR
ncbi:MAG: hypothetical protein IT371_09185 [Deltaproteobacteria bacterium]|nr:hypothetical protein [Deltaproteobacteria bacterium]